jgi:hypothetical protein
MPRLRPTRRRPLSQPALHLANVPVEQMLLRRHVRPEQRARVHGATPEALPDPGMSEQWNIVDTDTSRIIEICYSARKAQKAQQQWWSLYCHNGGPRTTIR